MDFLQDLEEMAALCDKEICEPDNATIERWKRLFRMADPYASILDFRQSLDQPHVSDEHWDEVSLKQEVLGHDRESYTYSLSIPAAKSVRPKARGKAMGTYLLKLVPACAPISSARAVQQAAGLSLVPATQKAEDTGDEFVRLSADAKLAIEDVLGEYQQVQATFVRLVLPAPKELDPVSRYPSLGIDTTLPQYRAGGSARHDLIQQGQYPVWYFFYGTLADPDVLRQKLDLDPEMEVGYLPAEVLDARLTTWGGKYNALVNGVEKVPGSAFEVKNKEQEDALREYETDHYEVVRCDVIINGALQEALTFRFIG